MRSENILVIVAHPAIELSRLNRRMMRRAATKPTENAEGRSRIKVRDLYALYPDYLINVDAEQQALNEAQLVVWLHPFHWYGMPPLMKLWLDSVLEFGWAYGPNGTALRGKDLWLVVSTGGSEQSYRPDGYNRYFFDAFLPPYEQTAALCGMRFLAPMTQHDAHRLSEAEIDGFSEFFADRLRSYPRWPELEMLENCVDCEVPADARPGDAESRPPPKPPFLAKPTENT